MKEPETISINTIRDLRDNRIGLILTALVAGVRNRERINTWCAGILTPSPAETKRLVFAMKVLSEVAEAEHSWNTARAWFIGANVGEDLVSPVEAIRMDRFDEVLLSAQRLIHNIPFSA